MFVRSSFLIVVVAFSVGKPTDVTFDNGDEAELEQMRRRGHGLGRCKLYRPPPAPTDECPAKDRIFFKVENFDRAFSRRCRDYIPQDNEDLQIDDIHEAIQDACEVKKRDSLINAHKIILHFPRRSKVRMHSSAFALCRKRRLAISWKIKKSTTLRMSISSRLIWWITDAGWKAVATFVRLPRREMRLITGTWLTFRKIKSRFLRL